MPAHAAPVVLLLGADATTGALLRALGYTVHAASREALPGPSATGAARPQLIVVREERAWALARLVGRLSCMDDWAPLVVLTRAASMELRRAAFRCGAVDVVRLPASSTELRVRLQVARACSAPTGRAPQGTDA